MDPDLRRDLRIEDLSRLVEAQAALLGDTIATMETISREMLKIATRLEDLQRRIEDIAVAQIHTRVRY